MLTRNEMMEHPTLTAVKVLAPLTDLRHLVFAMAVGVGVGKVELAGVAAGVAVDKEGRIGATPNGVVPS